MEPREGEDYLDGMEDFQGIDDDAVLFDLPSVDFHFAFLVDQIPAIGDFFASISQVFLNHPFDLDERSSRDKVLLVHLHRRSVDVSL